MSEQPAVIVIDATADVNPALDPQWEWMNVSTITDPPWVTRWARGRKLQLPAQVNHLEKP